MKKILQKRQLQTVMLLFAVIFILLCGVAYTISTRDSGSASIPTVSEKPPHEILREARASANERIMWETNLGGTENESPVSVFTKNNEIYIFGNTNSSDLDFAANSQGKTRGFGARLSASGRTLGFTVFDFTVAKAIPTLSGFAVAGNEGSVAGLYLLSDTLSVTAKVMMPPTHALTACGLYVFDNRYFLVAESFNEITQKKTLLLHVYTTGLSLEREKVFSHTYSLELLDILPYKDGYILAAAADFQELGYLTLARFTTISEPAYTDLNLGYAYTPAAFLPLGAGYASISDRDGNCELLLLDENLAKTDVKFLTKTPNANKKTLFYAAGTFAYTGEKLIELSADGRSVGSVEFAPKEIAAFASNGTAAFVAGIGSGKLDIAYIGKQSTELYSLSVESPSCAAICAGGTSLLIAADTRAKTDDCADFFGESDVWLAKLPLL